MRAFEEITKDAMDLLPREKIALAGLLLETAGEPMDPGTDAAWESELDDRIRAIDEGRVSGVAYEDVMKEATSLLRS